MTTSQAVRARYIAIWERQRALIVNDPQLGLTAQLPGLQTIYLVGLDEITPLPEPHRHSAACFHAIVLPLSKTRGVEICYYCRQTGPLGTCPAVCPQALRETTPGE